MVRLGYDDFENLFTEVSLEIIEEIDRLWMEYSEGKFGIKGQARIYRELGGTEHYNEKVWDDYARSVGWLWENGITEIQSVNYNSTEVKDFYLPILLYYYGVWLGLLRVRFWQFGDVEIGALNFFALVSRLE